MNLSSRSILTLAVALAAGSGANAQQEAPVAGQPAAKAEQAPPQRPPSARERREGERSISPVRRPSIMKTSRLRRKTSRARLSSSPTIRSTRLRCEIARQHQVTALVQAADKAKLLGRSDEARTDLIEAFHLDPNNPMVAQHIDEIASLTMPCPISEQHSCGGGRRRGAHRARRGADAPQLSSAHECERPTSPGAGRLRITATLDSSVKNQSVRFDADDVDFNEAARMVKLVTKTFFVPLDPSRVLVAEDTKDNRTRV